MRRRVIGGGGGLACYAREGGCSKRAPIRKSKAQARTKEKDFSQGGNTSTGTKNEGSLLIKVKVYFKLKGGRRLARRHTSERRRERVT